MSRRTSERASTACFISVLALLCGPGVARAKELDQFTDRATVLAYYAGDYRKIVGAPSPEQVDALLDAEMNALLTQLEAALRSSPPRTRQERDARVRAAFQHQFLPELLTPYEEWVKHEAEVPLYKVRDKGIYGHAVDYDDVRMSWYIELSPIIQVAGVTLGIDKLGHFIAQGFQYYEHDRGLDPRLSAAARAGAMRSFGHQQEAGSLGIATTGVYSYADLAANWQGMLFFLSMFDDVQLEGQSSARFFALDEHGLHRRVRDFHWADWLTHDWDEVLNPSAAQTEQLYRKVSDNFQRRSGLPGAERPSICESFRTRPAVFSLEGAEQRATANGSERPALRPRASYTDVAAGARAAPWSIDVRTICGRPASEHALLPP